MHIFFTLLLSHHVGWHSWKVGHTSFALTLYFKNCSGTLFKEPGFLCWSFCSRMFWICDLLYLNFLLEDDNHPWLCENWTCFKNIHTFSKNISFMLIFNFFCPLSAWVKFTLISSSTPNNELESTLIIFFFVPNQTPIWTNRQHSCSFIILFFSDITTSSSLALMINSVASCFSQLFNVTAIKMLQPWVWELLQLQFHGL